MDLPPEGEPTGDLKWALVFSGMVRGTICSEGGAVFGCNERKRVSRQAWQER